jgi:hypothetical protein
MTTNYAYKIKLPINYDILYQNLRENRNNILDSVLGQISSIEKTSEIDDFNLGYFSVYLDGLSLGAPGFSSDTRSIFCKMTQVKVDGDLEFCLKQQGKEKGRAKARHWKFLGLVS